MLIERYLRDYLHAAQTPCKQDAYFDTASILHAAASNCAWTDETHRAMEFLSKRAEISRGLYESYQENGTRLSSYRLSEELSILALVLLFKDFRRLFHNKIMTGAVKRLNGVLKLLDLLSTENIALLRGLTPLIKAEAEQFLETLQHTAPPSSVALTNTATPLTTRDLPLTVLFWEGPIARAYLATLKSMGLKPEKIIHLVSKNDLVTQKPLGRFLPRSLKVGYAQSRQKSSIHYWSTTLRKTRPALCRSIKETVESRLAFPEKVINDALALEDLSEYSPDVETLMIGSLADDTLYDRLLALPETQILFTGGGIVPKNLLEIASLKFIHIHPGHLPEIRGADCVLWSHLMKGCASATCFYMAPGIDDGDIILASYLPPLEPHFDTCRTDLKTLYRATYAFLDPWVRAFVLRQALGETAGFTRTQAKPQAEHNSVTYHFMHELVQRAAFAQLFAEK